jgi:hypothetical protein
MNMVKSVYFNNREKQKKSKKQNRLLLSESFADQKQLLLYESFAESSRNVEEEDQNYYRMQSAFLDKSLRIN